MGRPLARSGLRRTSERKSSSERLGGRLMARLKLRYVNEYRDRHGKVRRYFRRPGSRAIALPGLPGSIEFMAAYQAALAIVAPPPPSPKHVIAGSLADVVARYYGSALFANLSSAAQQPIEPRSRKSSRLTVIVCCATCRRMPRS